MPQLGYIIKKTMPEICYPLYLQFKYKKELGIKCDLQDPKTYTEKMQWAKLNRRNELLTVLTDKIEARKWVARQIGDKYLIPTIGSVYDRAEDIDFEALPDSFVIKANNGSGFNIIVSSKADENFDVIRKQLNDWLKFEFAYFSLELQYRDIKPRIYIEQNLLDDGKTDLPDYKFFCFNGKVFCSYTRVDTYEGHDGGRVGFFDRDYYLMPYYRKEYKRLSDQIEKPANYEKMIEIAEKLSKGFSHVRVDLYNINGAIYFGEMTFTTNSGYIHFVPKEFDQLLGEQWDLGSGI